MTVPVRPSQGTHPLREASAGSAGVSSRSTSHVMAGYEERERELWRWSMLLLVLLATALGAAAWETLEEFHPRVRLLPFGVVVLVIVLVVLVARKKSEVDRLRATVQLVQGAHTAAGPAEGDSARLLDIVKRSQGGYRALIDSFDDAVFALSLDGEILAANRRFAETLDLSFPEIIGRRLDEFLSEPNTDEVAKGVPRFVERRHWAGIVRMRLKASGGIRFFDCVLHAIVREGEVEGASVLARDVTHERESEARFAELFETLQEGIYFSTPDGRFLDANPALVRMLGYSDKEELLKVSVPDIYVDREDRAALLAEIDDMGRLRNREITLRRLDGSTILCLDTCSVERDPSGQIVRFQGTLVDITTQRDMEKKLHREQEFARRLIDSFPDVIVVRDDQARFTYVSPRVREVLGYPPEELIGGP